MRNPFKAIFSKRVESRVALAGSASPLKVVPTNEFNTLRKAAMNAQFGSGYYNSMREIEASLTTFMRGVSESKTFTQEDRITLISIIRRIYRDSPILSAAALTSVRLNGVPKFKLTAKLDPKTVASDWNREASEYLYDKMKGCLPMSMGRGNRSFDSMTDLYWYELFFCNEVFVIELPKGEWMLIPSERCGSPVQWSQGSSPLITTFNGKECYETDGIGFYLNGERAYYRFAPVSLDGNLSFDERDGAFLLAEKYVHHCGQGDRVDQIRYVPRLMSCLPTLINLEKLIVSKVAQFQLAASFGVFVTKNNMKEQLEVLMEKFGLDFSDLPTVKINPNLPNGTKGNEINIAEHAMMQVLSGIYERTGLGEITFPNKSVVPLAPGESVVTAQSNFNGADFKECFNLLMQIICAPLGLAREEVMGDYGDTNYSSARAIKLTISAGTVRPRNQYATIAERVIERFLEIGEAFGEIPPRPTGNRKSEQITLVYPVIKEIDEVQQAKAQRLKLENGTLSISQAQQQEGNYAEDVLDQRVSDAKDTAQKIKEAADEIGVQPVEIEKYIPSKQPPVINIASSGGSQNTDKPKGNDEKGIKKKKE